MKLINILLKAALLISLFSLCFLFIYSSFRANAKQLQVCPVKAITMQNGRAVIDSIRCIGCGRCALGIPSPYNLTLFPAIKPKPNTVLNAITNTDSIQMNKDQYNVKTNPDNAKSKTQSEKNTIKDKVVSTVKKLVYIVSPEQCIGCTLCVEPCPVDAITMIDGKAVIDTGRCIADGICVNGNGSDFAGCPVSAISTQSR